MPKKDPTNPRSGYRRGDNPKPTSENPYDAKNGKGRICGAKRKSDGMPCKIKAGSGTMHPGVGPCSKHGGNMYKDDVTAAAAKDANFKRAIIYGGPMEIGPHEALLMEIHRTAGHVQWLAEKIAAMDTEAEMLQYTLQGIRPNAWVDLYAREREHLIRSCKMALDAGVAERQVALAEEQGKLLAMAIAAILHDRELMLTGEQRAIAPKIVRKHLMALPGASFEITQDLKQRTSAQGPIPEDVVIG